MVKSQKTVCWVKACLTVKLVAIQENRIQRLHFLFVTRSPKVQDVSFDFEEFFRPFGCRKEKVGLHSLTKLASLLLQLYHTVL